MIQEVKLMVIGAEGAGKSSLLLQFVYGQWIPNYSPTIEENYRKGVQIDENEYSLDILDTAGHDQFSHMRNLYSQQCQGLLAVFDIGNEQSFITVQQQIQQIRAINKGERLPIILVGNKSDLSQTRVVTIQRANQLAKSLQTVYIEASAKLSLYVSDCFIQLVRLLQRKRIPSSPPFSSLHSSPKVQHNNSHRFRELGHRFLCLLTSQTSR